MIYFPTKNEWDNMPPNRKNDKRWSDKFMPAIEELVSTRWEYLYPAFRKLTHAAVEEEIKKPPQIIKPGLFREDSEWGVDVVAARYMGLYFPIAFRINREKIDKPKPHNVGIRVSRISGVRTEYDKMKDGNYPPVYLCGWGYDDGPRTLIDWFFYDVPLFVSEGHLEYCRQHATWCEKEPPYETKAGYVSQKQIKNCILVSAKTENQETRQEDLF